MTKSNTETEVKIRLPNGSATLKNLFGLGFKVSVNRDFEVNVLYDTVDQVLRGRGMLLRLRQFGDTCVITWKGPGEPGLHKSRPELECSIGSVEIVDQILRNLGYLPTFRYEKYRTEFSKAGGDSPGVVTFDETPIGTFLEIEGSAEWIDSTAEQLGFSNSDYVLESYGQLYLDFCRTRNVQPQNMVFTSEGQ